MPCPAQPAPGRGPLVDGRPASSSSVKPAPGPRRRAITRLDVRATNGRAWSHAGRAPCSSDATRKPSGRSCSASMRRARSHASASFAGNDPRAAPEAPARAASSRCASEGGRRRDQASTAVAGAPSHDHSARTYSSAAIDSPRHSHPHQSLPSSAAGHLDPGGATRCRVGRPKASDFPRHRSRARDRRWTARRGRGRARSSRSRGPRARIARRRPRGARRGSDRQGDEEDGSRRCDKAQRRGTQRGKTVGDPPQRGDEGVEEEALGGEVVEKHEEDEQTDGEQTGEEWSVVGDLARPTAPAARRMPSSAAKASRASTGQPARFRAPSA